MSNITIHNTDVIEYLKNYTGPKFHAVLSDPPYGLAFMGKAWDKYTPKEYQEWVAQWASLLLEHLYPGAVCMFFGGTRTYHRLATGLEDAGFEVFDSMIWCYGSGFPKSHNISKAIEKSEGYLPNKIIPASGVGFMNTNDDGWHNTANQYVYENYKSENANNWNGYGTALKPAFEPIVLCRKPRGKETFVDCALNYGSGALNVDGGRIGVELLIGQNEGKNSMYGVNSPVYTPDRMGRFPANLGLICDCEQEPCECDYQTIGNSARFFYTAKSSRKERNLGLDIQNNHPTVKPIKLTEYLSKLLLPPIENSSILIPFSGSGSDVIGSMLSGWSIITSLEIDESYCTIQQNRVDYWKQYKTYDEAMKGEK